MVYVYYLHSPEGGLLYIGRGAKPLGRKASFELRTGLKVLLGVCQRHTTLEAACDAERAAIRKHKPPYNKKVASAVGRVGLRNTPEQNAAIGLANKGRVRSLEVRKKLSEANKGKPGHAHTPHSKALLSKARTKNRYQYKGQLLTVKELAAIAGIEEGTMKYRLRAGWSAEKAVTRAVQ